MSPLGAKSSLACCFIEVDSINSLCAQQPSGLVKLLHGAWGPGGPEHKVKPRGLPSCRLKCLVSDPQVLCLLLASTT